MQQIQLWIFYIQLFVALCGRDWNVKYLVQITERGPWILRHRWVWRFGESKKCSLQTEFHVGLKLAPWELIEIASQGQAAASKPSLTSNPSLTSKSVMPSVRWTTYGLMRSGKVSSRVTIMSRNPLESSWFTSCQEPPAWPHSIKCKAWWRRYHGVGLILRSWAKPLNPSKWNL